MTERIDKSMGLRIIGNMGYDPGMSGAWAVHSFELLLLTTYKNTARLDGIVVDLKGFSSLPRLDNCGNSSLFQEHSMTTKHQRELLQAVWRKAGQTGEPIEIPCKTPSDALRVRFSLYNAVKGVRDGTQEADEDLKAAVAGCSVGFKDGDQSVIVLRPKVLADLTSFLEDLVGDALVPEGEPVKPEPTEEELKMTAMQDRLLEQLKGPPTDGEVKLAPPTRVTPYYQR